jgi:hypothetical protein
MATPRRHTTEFGLVIPLDRTMLVEPRALRVENIAPALQQYADSCHLYMIGHRPMTCIDPRATSVEGDVISARFISRVASEEAIVECTWTHPGLKDGAEIDSPWPHNIVRILNSSGHQVLRRNASVLLAQAVAFLDSPADRLLVDIQFLDLEVEYVGKSFGKRGERSAFTRLQSHSTLQRMMAELPRDEELWIVLLDGSTYTVLTSMVPQGQRGDAADQEDDARIETMFDSPLSDAAITDIVEGSLIKYFQPRYNVQLKESFPDRRARPLAEAYARDLNLIGFELDTWDLSLRLGSPAGAFSFEHSTIYPLHSDGERKSMLDFVDDIEALRERREAAAPPDGE